jgi:hypothetical protein
MKKHKVVIQIFPMVTDIDFLERTLLLLKQASINVDKEKFYVIVDINLPISDYLTDWDNSTIKQDYFIKKFKNLEKYMDWCDEYDFNLDYEVKGIIDCTIKTIYKYSDIDSLISLDTDIIFNSYALGLILESSLEIQKIQPRYIITPECVKLWDETWDVLVNENFQNQSYGYEKTNDPVVDSFNVYGDISLEPINTYKFGLGWFTLFSKPLLDYIKFPKDIQGYGPIDTFIMFCCPHIPNTTQYKIKNLVVTEDYKHSDRTLYNDYVKIINRKTEASEYNWKKMISHLQNNLINPITN